ncbi:E3 ubiquitin-protein ligase TRIM39-like [Pristis pectinata]|uniref:E3 ubiquitin-protein ligase TRIM39-like n=1 Tax=Pristis pectinata TaxID=685728 RepID=UPI00223E56CD|nr:E3 ubiquitin-protein ligase TRIM39-like [Pristis pectinata]
MLTRDNGNPLCCQSGREYVAMKECLLGSRAVKPRERIPLSTRCRAAKAWERFPLSTCQSRGCAAQVSPTTPRDSLILCFSPPVSVTLDVETAHPEIEVSEDLKGVRRAWTPRDLPDTGKRFTSWKCALGSKGFTSGRHYWEVEVAGNREWGLGVAAESVERKRGVELRPENGFWTIERWWWWPWGYVEFYANTSPRSPLPADPIPGRVGVCLSYESGTVSFYSADSKSHLHTFTGNKFTEKLYPFFWTWNENQWLRICSRSVNELGPGTGVRSGVKVWGRDPVDGRLVLNGSHLIARCCFVKTQ